MTKAINIFRENRESIISSWIQSRRQGAQTELEDLEVGVIVTDDDMEFFESCMNFLSEQPDLSSVRHSGMPPLEIIRRICFRDKDTLQTYSAGRYIRGLEASLVAALKEKITEPGEFLLHASAISTLLDDLKAMAFENFLDDRDARARKEKQSEWIRPVLRVWEGILAVPLAGEISPVTVQNIFKDLLGHLAKQTSFTIVIIDVSGVSNMNLEVANYLSSAASTIHVMGGKCIVSGIQPAAARNMIHQGIDLSNLIIKTRLSDAVKTSFALLGLQVVK
jgi:rsbT co-antagonist protein RsbR